METSTYLSMEELEAGMEHIRQSPKDYGTLIKIVRPQDDGREIVNEAELTLTDGLVGDNWRVRGSKHMPDGSANPNAQITVMNARIIELIAQTEDRWALAGDQLYVDLDLSRSCKCPALGDRYLPYSRRATRATFGGTCSPGQRATHNPHR